MQLQIQIEIYEVRIITGNHADVVLIKIDKPSATWPYNASNLTLRFEAAKDNGLNYAKEILGIPEELIKVINT